jgi:dolichol-phosphate mannosyltransferase
MHPRNAAGSSRSAPDLSVVIPVFNEGAMLTVLYQRLAATLNRCVEHGDWDVVFVNDGSTDRTGEVLSDLRRQDPRVKIVTLSRNFGQQMAVSAGIDFAAGDAVVLMDADLQDPPEVIPDLLDAWKKGVHVVYAVRQGRKEGLLKRMAFVTFYRVLQLFAGISIPLDAGMFSLMDRRVVEVLRSMPERNRYLSGLRAWTGFTQIGIPCERGARDDAPRQSVGRLFKIAMDAVFSFSYVPMRVATLLGLLVSAVSFVVGLFALEQRLFTANAIPGWASNLVATTFLNGLTLLMLGFVGEYLARIYDEVKGRPRYVVAFTAGFEEAREERL